MSKAITGIAELGGALAMGTAAFFDPALIASPLYDKIMAGLVIQGVASEAGALAQALTSNRGQNITTRQPAANRQIILGMQRVGGDLVFPSSTGSKHDQYNKIVIIASHEIHSILGLYLDGRKVYWDTSSEYNADRNGVNFGGQADGNDHIGPDGTTYNFGGLVFCEPRYGDQVSGDVLASLNANDPNWAPSANGNPYLGGMAYIYLKIEYDTSMFPSEPEIRIDVNGKCDIYDPRTQTKGFTTNWALLVADRMTDPVFGLGMDYSEINEAQLIAAANVCDEEVELAAGGTEARYSCNWHFDTATGPADVIATMMTAAAGRMSRIGGQWYIWPAYWQGPSFSFDQNIVLADAFSWSPYRSLRDRVNRITGVYCAANYPYNAAGNEYDPDGWYDGTLQNNFGFAFQPTNFPQFAMDVAHGYPSDQWLTADGGHALPREVNMSCVQSVSQAQRVAKCLLMRNRYEGSGSMSCTLAAWGMQPTDVMQFTFPQRNWSNKVLEITGVAIHLEELQADNGDRVPAAWLGLSFCETGPDAYEWHPATEELTVYAVPAGITQAPYVVAPPSSLTLASASSTGQNAGLGGNSTNWAIRVSFNQPADALVTLIQIQAKAHSDTAWFDAGTYPVISSMAYVYGVNQGSAYDVRIRSLRPSGAASAWVEQDNYTV